MLLVLFGLNVSAKDNVKKQAKVNEEILNYEIDKEHTEIGFEVAHLVISRVKGRFDKFDGKLQLKGDKLDEIDGTVQAASINSNQEKRDKHLRSADFFDVEKFPLLSFEVKNLSLDAGKFKKVKGKLTIHGITRDEMVEIEYKGKVTDPWGSQKIVVNATAKIHRKDYGLIWNEAMETGGVMVGDEVKIEVLAQANKK